MVGETSSRSPDPSQPDLSPSGPSLAKTHETTILSSEPVDRSSTGDGTAFAPTCPPTLAPHPKDPARSRIQAGEVIDDFQILRILGEGAFGTVYLARQASLDRQVALKITASQGNEGRNMAQLEHEHIVQVFSETVDRSGSQRLLCMQYVPGPTLDALLRKLRAGGPDRLSGAELVKALDELTAYPTSFDPGALRNREVLQVLDWTETVCWIGARLAEALAYAHERGVIHRDIKPANILVSQYGRPMLVDFNLAFRPLDTSRTAEDLFGGTLAYMAPEHLDAFNPSDPTEPEIVGPAADIYALGVVLFEMLTGRPLDYERPPRSDIEVVLRMLADQRRRSIPDLPKQYPRVLNQTIQRCLQPDPQLRPASGRELCEALEGCREFHSARKAIPAPGRLRRQMARHPFRWLILMGLLPNLVSSIVNVSYNQIRIISHLTESQQTTFLYLVWSYNLFSYCIGFWLAFRVVVPVYRVWRRLRDGPTPEAELVDRARAQSLAWPAWAGIIACQGWLPGGIVFAVGLAVASGPIPWAVVLHLIVSFTLSGLIALVYCFLLVQWIEVFEFYPGLWSDVRHFRRKAARQLKPIPRRLRLFQILAGLIPLSGALLMVGIGPQELSPAEYQSFRFLVIGLIGTGMAGFQLAMFITGRLTMVVETLTAAPSAAK